MADDLSTSSSNATGVASGTTFRMLDLDTAGKLYSAIAKALTDGTTFQGWEQGNVSLGTLLASAARTAAANTSDQHSVSHRGVMLILDVTASTSTKTLSLKIQAKDPVSSNYVTVYDFGVVVTSAGSAVTAACILMPGLIAADVASGSKGLSGQLPATWRAVVTPNDATSWTYSLGGFGLR